MKKLTITSKVIIFLLLSAIAIAIYFSVAYREPPIFQQTKAPGIKVHKISETPKALENKPEEIQIAKNPGPEIIKTSPENQSPKIAEVEPKPSPISSSQKKRIGLDFPDIDDKNTAEEYMKLNQIGYMQYKMSAKENPGNKSLARTKFFTDTADVFYQKGEKDQALLLLEWARSSIEELPKNLKSNNLLNIVNRQIKYGNKDEAISTLELAKQEIVTLKDSRSKSSLLSLIAMKQFEAGDNDGARLTLENAKNYVYENQDNQKIVANDLMNIGRKQIKISSFSQARNTFGEARDAAKSTGESWFTDKILKRIVEVQLQSGDIAGAETTAKSIEVTIWKCNALLDIGNSLIRAGEKEKARQIFDEAAGATNLTEDVNLKNMIASKISKAQTRAGF